jgi:hypothetical protein
MWLAAHSVELFLKGMILTRASDKQLHHHRLDALDEEYRTLFREPEYQIDIPFRAEYVSMSEDLVRLTP